MFGSREIGRLKGVCDLVYSLMPFTNPEVAQFDGTRALRLRVLPGHYLAVVCDRGTWATKPVLIDEASGSAEPFQPPPQVILSGPDELNVVAAAVTAYCFHAWRSVLEGPLPSAPETQAQARWALGQLDCRLPPATPEPNVFHPPSGPPPIQHSPLTARGFTAPGDPRCLACGLVHPLWPDEALYPPFADLRTDRYAAGLVMRVLSASGAGSPQCNAVVLHAPIETYRRGLVDHRISFDHRRWATRERQAMRQPPALHELVFAQFNVLSLFWAMAIVKAHGTDDVRSTLLTEVVQPANSMLADIPPAIREAATDVLGAGVSPMSVDGTDMTVHLFRESLAIENWAEQLGGDFLATMHAMLLCSASYATYAAARVIHVSRS